MCVQLLEAQGQVLSSEQMQQQISHLQQREQELSDALTEAKYDLAALVGQRASLEKRLDSTKSQLDRALQWKSDHQKTLQELQYKIQIYESLSAFCCFVFLVPYSIIFKSNT